MLVAALIASGAMAQRTYTDLVGNKVRYGIQAGLNFSNYWGGDAPDATMKPGIQLGAIMEYKDAKFRNFSSQTGLLFSQKGGNEDGDKLALNYLLVPIIVQYNLGLGNSVGFFLKAEYYFGYAISGKYKYNYEGTWESEKIDFSDEGLQRFDMGLGLGVGLNINDMMQIGLGYNWSFYPLVKNPGYWVNFYNSNLALNVTFLFGK